MIAQIVSLALRLVAVLATAWAGNLVVRVVAQHWQVALDGKPLPYVTQTLIDGRSGFLILAVIWLVWAVVLALRKRTPAQLELFAAASFCVVALIISLVAASTAGLWSFLGAMR